MKKWQKLCCNRPNVIKPTKKVGKMPADFYYSDKTVHKSHCTGRNQPTFGKQLARRISLPCMGHTNFPPLPKNRSTFCNAARTGRGRFFSIRLISGTPVRLLRSNEKEARFCPNFFGIYGCGVRYAADQGIRCFWKCQAAPLPE